MSLVVEDFKWKLGVNDKEYIHQLEQALERQRRLTDHAIKKIRKLTGETSHGLQRGEAGSADGSAGIHDCSLHQC